MSDDGEDFGSLLDESLTGALSELGENVYGEVKQAVDERKLLDPLLRSLTSKKELDSNEVINMTMKNVVEAIQAQAISLLILEEDDMIHFKHVYYSNLLYAGSTQLKAAYEAKAEELKAISFPKNKGIAGKVVTGGKTYVAFDAPNDPNFYGGVDQDTGFVTKSMITVPMKVKHPDGSDHVFGAIQVLNKEGGEVFSDIDVGMLEEVTSYSSKAIQAIFFKDVEFAPNDLAFYKARLTRNKFLDLTSGDFELDKKLLELVDEKLWKSFNFLPVEKEGANAIAIAMSDPLDFVKKEDFEIRSEFKIGTIYVAAEELIQQTLNQAANAGTSVDFGAVVESVGEEYGKVDDVEKLDVSDKDATEDSAPIIKLSNRIIEDAYVKGASDIHVESFEQYVLVRYRIDGMCKKILELPKDISKPLLSRFKIMGSLDIAEKRRPQSGRIVFKNFTSTNVDVDLRIEVAPMNHGEKACMRILDKSKSTLPLDKLGFSKINLEKYREAIKVPFGMVLHVGPTGSGKSMTLYSALGERITPDLNIHTAEDPIEYTIEGINQMQMNPKAGVTFASALRSFLRMDPDIILVGEIRDKETADIAVEAALTGHLLFSTLHTNDASGTIVRFTEMGIENFMISSSLVCVCAQRLMRRLCKKCKVAYKPTETDKKLLDIDKFPVEEIFKANLKGCDKCSNIGYKGRVGTHELLVMNEPLRDSIGRGDNTNEIKKIAVNEADMITLHKDSMTKVREGITDIDEALRVVKPD